ncbi:MAG: DUF4129 domain-containing protein [Planctomycetota bacterium]
MLVGCLMIVALLVVAALLPRPSGESSAAGADTGVDSPDRESSKYAMMDGEGADEDKGGPRSGSRKDEPDGQDESDEQGEGSGSGKGGSQSGSGEDGERSGSSEQSGKSGSGSEGDDEGSGSDSEKGKSGGSDSSSKSGKGEKPKEEKGRDGKQSESKEEEDSDSGSSGSSGSGSQQNDGDRQGDQSGGSDDGQDESSEGDDGESSSFDPIEALTKACGWIGTLLKWIFYVVLIGVIIFWAWRNRTQIVAWLRGWLDAWRDFWARLFGGKAAADEEAASEEGPEKERRRPFSDFTDPFTHGTADRYSPDELVRYTFEAFEAWARDHGCPRQPDQTPHEFANQVGEQVGSLAEGARRLADLYCRVAYAPGTLPPRSVAPLERFWRELREREWMPV